MSGDLEYFGAILVRFWYATGVSCNTNVIGRVDGHLTVVVLEENHE